MALSSELISQLAKATKPAENKPTEATVFGTTVLGENGDPFVQIDGSDAITPVTSTVRVNQGERVVVRIGNHSAVVMGNITTPSASTDDVDELADEITEMGIVIADKVSAEELDVVIGHIETLIANDVTITGRLDASEASIAELEAGNVTITGRLDAAEATIGHLETDKLDASVADITFATIEDLTAINAVINNLDATYATIEELEAVNAVIGSLDTKYATIEELDAVSATIESLDATYADIEFANIGDAAIENLFTKAGMIEDLVVSDGHVTGTLVGVTILGDYIKGGTIQADKLIIKGEDGLYYQMNIEGGATTSEQVSEEDLQNGLSGSIIVANSITAEKIYVDDLSAFNATIGGLHLTDGSLYSGVKESIDNSTNGFYFDSEGQMSVGDSGSFIRYYKTDDNTRRLEISADSLMFSTTGKTVEQFVDEATDIDIGARNLLRNSVSLRYRDYYFESVGPTDGVTVEHDGAGNVFVTSGALTVDHDGDGNVFLNGGI